MPADELIKAINELLQEECLKCNDPYDLYINRLRAHIYSNPSEASARFQQGYKTLLEKISHE